MPNIATGAIILGWYGSNVGVLLLNKYLLSVYGFKFPAFLTLCHMLACSIMSYGLAISNTVTLQPIKSKKQFYKIATLALIFCVAVVMGNVSLNYIPVSFNQAIGATTPAFTAVLSAVMLGHRESKDVYLSLVPVVVGIVIASGAEPMFNLVGFLSALMATAGRGLKSVLQGLMLSDSSEKMDSLSLLLYMAPVATAALVPITLYFEPTALANALVLGQSGGFWTLLCFNAFMAYFVNLTNFLVTKYTSPLTLQVLGNAKGVVAVVASVICFRNPVTFYTILGYSITVGGVILYSNAKRQSRKVDAIKKLSAAKVSDIEQPSSPFTPSNTINTAESRERNISSDRTDAEGNALDKPQHHHGRGGSNLSSSSFSDRIMARGFSSIFEA